MEFSIFHLGFINTVRLSSHYFFSVAWYPRQLAKVRLYYYYYHNLGFYPNFEFLLFFVEKIRSSIKLNSHHADRECQLAVAHNTHIHHGRHRIIIVTLMIAFILPRKSKRKPLVEPAHVRRIFPAFFQFFRVAHQTFSAIMIPDYTLVLQSDGDILYSYPALSASIRSIFDVYPTDERGNAESDLTEARLRGRWICSGLRRIGSHAATTRCSVQYLVSHPGPSSAQFPESLAPSIQSPASSTCSTSDVHPASLFLYSIDIVALKPQTTVPCQHDNIEVELAHAYGGSTFDVEPVLQQDLDPKSTEAREIALHRARLCAPRKILEFIFYLNNMN
jgi:hypothetical protein